jgi:4a-hydroxytetrahydrobiopterin dehydratase
MRLSSLTPAVRNDVGGTCEDAGMNQILTRKDASDAVSDLGWRLVLGTLRTRVRAGSLAQAAELAALAIAAGGADADQHLRADLRSDAVLIAAQTFDRSAVGPVDIDLAKRITSAMRDVGAKTEPEIDPDGHQSVQVLEIAIDAMDIAAIRPFWKAVLGYADEPGTDIPQSPLVDPAGQSPSIWFQQMDEPRPQRNRIHFDVSVPHDQAEHRINATLAAGGRLVSDAEAPAFWVLADPEGNEACITTWQGRDG